MKPQKFASEFVGTALLAATIIGTGFMAKNLAPDSPLMQLFVNGAAAAAMLSVIIRLGAEASGSHFNPAVTIAFLIRKEIKPLDALNYIATQILGAILGAFLANAMFSDPNLATSTVDRLGSKLFLSEIIATAGLVWVVMAFGDSAKTVAKLVPLWIFAAYFFTASSTFANPAVTIGRVFTTSPAGISANSILAFIAAQIIGAGAGVLLFNVISNSKK